MAVRYSDDDIIVAKDLFSLACMLPEKTSCELPGYATKTTVYFLKGVPLDSDNLDDDTVSILSSHSVVCRPLHFYLSIPGESVSERMELLPQVLESPDFTAVCGDTVPDIMVVAHGDVDGSGFSVSYAVTLNQGYDFVVSAPGNQVFPSPDFLFGITPSSVAVAAKALRNLHQQDSLWIDASPICDNTGDIAVDQWVQDFITTEGDCDVERMLTSVGLWQ